MCACERKPKNSERDSSRRGGSPDSDKVEVSMDGDVSEFRGKQLAEGSVMNGGPNIGSTPQGHSDHKRQASTSSGSAGLRPTSLRELPEPPVSAKHSRNTSMSGVELPPVPDAAIGGSMRGEGDEGVGNNMYAYPKHVSPRGMRTNVKTSGQEVDQVRSHSDGYDHLGQKPQGKLTDYDSLSPGSGDGDRSPLSEPIRESGDHYSLVRERTYDVVKDVKTKAGKLFDPYSTVADRGFTESKEEDPYNHIGDSDGGVSNSMIRYLRESSDVTDPYSTVQDGSGGDLNSALRDAGASSSVHSPKEVSPSSTKDSLNDYDYTEEEEEAEYAVVQKNRGDSQRRPNTETDDAPGARGSHASSEDFSFNGGMPPEPPRLYNAYEDGDETYEVTSPSGEKKEHRYSKVTARESLASMTARNALNPYEMVQDLQENTYATVDGGSGDGVVLRHVDSDDNNSNRNSQNSDTYAEIAISGGGLSNSVISNGSSVGGNNNSHSNSSSTNTGANVNDTNTSLSSGAPAPPSLDSLHLMTKSQTSSEGDRMSDRHLASPEDSGLDLGASGFPAVPAWGDRTFVEADEDSGGSTAEDGYSTLKRVDAASSRDNKRGRESSSVREPPHPSSNQVMITDDESGEVTQLSPGYTTVKDCLSEEDLAAEGENDPNYESVDEARAKLRLLYRTDRIVGEEGKDEGARSLGGSGTASPAKKNITVVQVLHSVKTSTGSSSSGTHSSPSSVQHTPPATISYSSAQKEEPLRNTSARPVGKKTKRRRSHDYEELDLSPPISPSNPSVLPSPSHPVAVSPSSPSPGATSPASVSLAEAQQRLARSHMYEEVSEVRAHSSRFNHRNANNAGPIATVDASPSPSPLKPFSSTTRTAASSSQQSPQERSETVNNPTLVDYSKYGAGKGKAAPGRFNVAVNNMETATGAAQVNGGQGGHVNHSDQKETVKPKLGPATWRKGRREDSKPGLPGSQKPCKDVGDGKNKDIKGTGSGHEPPGPSSSSAGTRV
ncbi:hypothetical protein PoB_001388100 [Plakobranchus ocellatus]|uniref:Uncharacterized protein n=1 Tax=Plakobranchus ocellatus TaxID=259542 RepID=A0AAV3YVA7_9GAST|nr:hypothetical protein PoB_001388100 [Plakobranchus ocellatus]